ncbi:unnamed protein product [Protopolystoma xenopodis]|uniref:Uncharacterized protein n=1 Tax=Protopolystoma xenopodis TaxID=117903 RepID=A0A448XH40_9PLAT|nr:unnamed protein product [Protopolystoma xenopodis]
MKTAISIPTKTDDSIPDLSNVDQSNSVRPRAIVKPEVSKSDGVSITSPSGNSSSSFSSLKPLSPSLCLASPFRVKPTAPNTERTLSPHVNASANSGAEQEIKQSHQPHKQPPKQTLQSNRSSLLHNCRQQQVSKMQQVHQNKSRFQEHPASGTGPGQYQRPCLAEGSVKEVVLFGKRQPGPRSEDFKLFRPPQSMNQAFQSDPRSHQQPQLKHWPHWPGPLPYFGPPGQLNRAFPGPRRFAPPPSTEIPHRLPEHVVFNSEDKTGYTNSSYGSPGNLDATSSFFNTGRRDYNGPNYCGNYRAPDMNFTSESGSRYRCYRWINSSSNSTFHQQLGHREQTDHSSDFGNEGNVLYNNLVEFVNISDKYPVETKHEMEMDTGTSRANTQEQVDGYTQKITSE